MSRPLHVLLVEDNLDLRRINRLLLERAGYAVRAGATWGELAPLLDEPVDMILLDMMLPEDSGEELLPRLRARCGAETAVAILSALPADQLSQIADRNAIRHVLQKGQVAGRTLVDAVTRICREEGMFGSDVS